MKNRTSLLFFVSLSIWGIAPEYGFAQQRVPFESVPANVEKPTAREGVMQPNTRLDVSGSGGNFSIVAGKGLDRQYRWDNCVVNANMAQRYSR